MSFASGDATVGAAEPNFDGQRLEVLRAVRATGVDFPIIMQYKGDWLVFSDYQNFEKTPDEVEAKRQADLLRSATTAD